MIKMTASGHETFFSQKDCELILAIPHPGLSYTLLYLHSLVIWVLIRWRPFV